MTTWCLRRLSMHQARSSFSEDLSPDTRYARTSSSLQISAWLSRYSGCLLSVVQSLAMVLSAGIGFTGTSFLLRSSDETATQIIINQHSELGGRKKKLPDDIPRSIFTTLGFETSTATGFCPCNEFLVGSFKLDDGAEVGDIVR